MAGYRPLQDPPSTSLVRAQRLLGCFRAVLSMELDPVVSRHPGWVGWGLSAALRPSPSSPPPHPQEGRLVEKESSEWQLQGQPTVLLTLAHIFHHFAPLLVRGCEGGERPRLRAGVLRCVRSSRLTWQDPHDQSSQTSRMSWGSGGGEEEVQCHEPHSIAPFVIFAQGEVC